MERTESEGGKAKRGETAKNEETPDTRHKSNRDMNEVPTDVKYL